MSLSGNLLAAATISEVKVFRLKDSKNTVRRALKVHKLELPRNLDEGARIVQFSPDSKWLLTIGMTNTIQLYRAIEPKNFKEGPQFLSKSVVLQRKSKCVLNEKEEGNFDAHGAYGRTISRIAFSADSRILVVADLFGFLDSWVLEGYEDLTQEEDSSEEQPQRPSHDSDDEDTDEESHPFVILGQHWIRNPAADVLPKLPTTPLLLSFRPVKPSASTALTNGHTTVHPTRHNPHPHSHNLPSGEDRLFVLTAQNHVYEYEILVGKLSNWSKRNPPSRLPPKFKDIRDRAMGSLWDINGGRERVWLYGSMWLFMFDLSRDFSTPEDRDTSDDVPKLNGISADATADKKRKRKGEPDAEETRRMKKRDTGAGNRIPARDLELGISRTIVKSQGSDQAHAQKIMMDAGAATSDEDDDSSSEDDATGLTTTLIDLRRGEKGGQSDGPDGGLLDTDGEPTPKVEPAQNKSGPAHWHTFKYRPILGVVSLEGGKKGGSGEHDDSRHSIEVALVERPTWDEDLPARFHGDQEWNK